MGRRNCQILMIMVTIPGTVGATAKRQRWNMHVGRVGRGWVDVWGSSFLYVY